MNRLLWLTTLAVVLGVCWAQRSRTCGDGESLRAVATSDGRRFRRCSPCLVGFAGVGGSCHGCQPGTIAPERGMTACIECPVGTYSERIRGRLTACSECPDGLTAPTTATSSDECI